jgi:hypothetical protein
VLIFFFPVTADFHAALPAKFGCALGAMHMDAAFILDNFDLTFWAALHI